VEAYVGRRGKGEGSIYQRKDGLWVGQYRIDTDLGQKTKYIYTKTRKDAAKKLTAALAERDKGIFYDSESLTLQEFLSRWLDSIEGTIRPRAYLRYEQSCRLHINPDLGESRLNRIKPLQLQALYRKKIDFGLSPRTVQIIHATLSKALKRSKAIAERYTDTL
jgi:hypothetical protein